MAVCTHRDDISADCIVDELGVFLLKVVEAFLTDVIAIEVLDELNNLMTEGFNDRFDLLRGIDEFNHLLERAGTMLIECDLDHLWSSTSDEGSALILIGVL